MSARALLSGSKLLTLSILFACWSYLQGQEALTPPTGAQQATPSVQIEYDKQPLPSDPDAAFDLVRKANGLGADALKPWYLKAHYQGFGARGKPASAGTLIIVWAARNHYHASYSSDSFHLDYYRAEDGVYREGSSERTPYVESTLWRTIMYPLQPSHSKVRLKLENRKLGQVSLDCLKYDFASGPETSYCVDKQRLVLRTSQQQGIGATYNKIFVFQHHFVAGDIRITDYGQLVLNISVDELRALKQDELATVDPPRPQLKWIS